MVRSVILSNSLVRSELWFRKVRSVAIFGDLSVELDWNTAGAQNPRRQPTTKEETMSNIDDLFGTDDESENEAAPG